MRILHLSARDTHGGAARSAYRLNGGLRAIGLDSRMVVQEKETNDESVTAFRAVSRCVENLLARLPGLESKLDLAPLRLYPKRKRITWSVGWLPRSLPRLVQRLNPDIVHLHWVSLGFVPIRGLRQFNRPIVWTLHDSWAFTGGCHLPGECLRYCECCGSCPLLGSNREYDLSRWVWHQKRRYWKGVDLTVVAPSKWLSERALSSSLLRERQVLVIPNPVDPGVFRPVVKPAAHPTDELAIGKKVILFGAMNSTTDPNKGFHLLQEATRRLSEDGWAEDLELVVFGNEESGPIPKCGIAARGVGMIHDEAALARLYSLADVCVIPSIQENFPNTVLEAFACGTPCVAFDTGGLSELVRHGQTGYLARPFDTENLARGIAWILDDDDRRQRISAHMRRMVETHFSLDIVSRRYAELYRQVQMKAAASKGSHGNP